MCCPRGSVLGRVSARSARVRLSHMMSCVGPHTFSMASPAWWRSSSTPTLVCSATDAASCSTVAVWTRCTARRTRALNVWNVGPSHGPSPVSVRAASSTPRSASAVRFRVASITTLTRAMSNVPAASAANVRGRISTSITACSTMTPAENRLTPNAAATSWFSKEDTSSGPIRAHAEFPPPAAKVGEKAVISSRSSWTNPYTSRRCTA